MHTSDIAKRINSNRCFLFVGSGPSCEVGYPSWQELAESVYETIKLQGLVTDDASYKKYLNFNKLPELFGLAEKDLGSKTVLVNLVKTLFYPKTRNTGVIYDIVSKWPFACYLTTNYDDEIKNYLQNKGEYYSVIGNSKADFAKYCDGVSNLIQKIHSDFDHQEDIILTYKDYKRLYTDDEGQYFRVKLRSIFEMYEMLIIGHSLADIDIVNVLQIAKNTASPERPIYMFAADCTKAEEEEYFAKYNIVLLTYSNADKKHSGLKKLLMVMDKFISPRNSTAGNGLYPNIPEADVETATALYLYRKLQGINNSDFLSPIILSKLFSLKQTEISAEAFLLLPIFSGGGLGTKYDCKQSIGKALDSLIDDGLVLHNNDKYIITDVGIEKVSELDGIKHIEKDQAYGQFLVNLSNEFPAILPKQNDLCKKYAEEIITTCFQKRGLTIAKQVFSGQSISTNELTDFFGYISKVASKIDDNELRLAFIAAMHTFLVKPNIPQKKYLAAISQGFFLYNLLGLDPLCIKVRKDIFDRNLWFCDSSIIIPFIAKGCYNNEYAESLFDGLNKLNAHLYTTNNLLKETIDHFIWAERFVKCNACDSFDFLRLALVKGSYKQNLFIDGFIQMSADGYVESFDEYTKLIFPKDNILLSLHSRLAQNGISVKNLSDFDGFSQDDYGDFEEAKAAIQKERESNNTFRSLLQIESEAEIWLLINNLRLKKNKLDNNGIDVDRYYFISLSRVLDKVYKQENMCSWTPEAVYRYISTFPGGNMDPNLLQQCMLHEFYYAGVSFVDNDKYKRFFGSTIDTAKQQFEKEKNSYISYYEEDANKLNDFFSNVPDLEKPFFTAQMGWRIAEREKEKAEAAKAREDFAVSRIASADEKIKKLEQERATGWKKRKMDQDKQESARIRNSNDPKHLAKRRRQAKKRNSRGKK